MTTPSDKHFDASDWLAAVIDSSFDAIVSKNLDSIIQSWNRGAERLFGYTADEAVGHSVLMLIPDSHRSEEDLILSRIRAGERIESYETIRRRKDGTNIHVSITVSPVRNRQGEIVGASKIARDITQAKESERRIRMLLREVNHRTKNQFAVILSIIRETTKRATNPEEFGKQVRERIMSLSRSHDLLVHGDWSGTSMLDLAREQLQAFDHKGQITMAGPTLVLNANAVQHLGMAFHELGTNSAKYGALASPTGKVDVHWSIREGKQLALGWNETLSAPAPQSERTGFGTVVLHRVVPQSVGGTATLERTAERLEWNLLAPLDSVLNSSQATS